MKEKLEPEMDVVVEGPESAINEDERAMRLKSQSVTVKEDFD